VKRKRDQKAFFDLHVGTKKGDKQAKSERSSRLEIGVSSERMEKETSIRTGRGQGETSGNGSGGRR